MRVRQQQYATGRLTVDQALALRESPEARGVFAVRAAELKTYSSVLAVSASSLAAPVVRLPPQIDRVRELLFRLSQLLQRTQVSPKRASGIAHKIGESLLNSVPVQLRDLIDQSRAVKFIGDVPLELLPSAGLPLGLRATTSRMPALPGNLLARHALMRAPLFLRPRAFREVLVVRSFSPDDPVRPILTDSLEVSREAGELEIKVRLIDVHTVDEFTAAFNEFDGTVAIFDGHGRHSRGTEGTIALSDGSRINPFALYGRIKVPPIVLLSACETHHVEGLEASVASAFLFMGAQSVLGTMVPIDARTAATLVARFLYPFDKLLPLVNRPIPWTEIVSGMLRMSYITDVLRGVSQHHGLAAAQWKEVHRIANEAINSFDLQWFDVFFRTLARHSGVLERDLRSLWMHQHYFTDTLHYVHLGQPEHIFVVPETHAADTLKESCLFRDQRG